MLLEYTLFALACFGHAYLLMVIVNITYSQPLHRHFLKVFRAVMGLLMLGGPIAFIAIYGVALDNPSRPEALSIYLLITLFMALVVYPYVGIRRAFRKLPEFIRSESVIVDIAKELGHLPYGDGETALLAKMPLNDIFRVEFTTLTIALPNLPAAWNGLTLLQISDPHFFGTPSREFYDVIVRKCIADGIPDLLLYTGDFIDEDRYIKWIEPVLGPLTWNVAAYAVLGNHDWWQDFAGVSRQLKAQNVRVIGNAWEHLDVRGEKLTVIGHQGPWFQPPPDMSACPADGFRLLLSHTPDNIGWAKRHNVSLMLSGHNHGGQVRIPLIGSVFVPSKFSRHYDMGTFYEPPTLLHVNRGLSGKEPLRFRCLPQVTRIVLRCG